MRKHPDFSGFDEIQASEALKNRLYASTREHLANKRPLAIRRKYTGVVAAATVCVFAIVLFVNSPFFQSNKPIVGTGEDSQGQNQSGTPSTPQSDASSNVIHVGDEMFKLMAVSPLQEGPRQVMLDGVSIHLPGMGPDYHPEIIDGKEVEVARGYISPSLLVEGETIQSVTYTTENEILSYEDPRSWQTADGFPIWASYTLSIPNNQFQNPQEPSLNEVIAYLEQEQDGPKLSGFTEQVLTVEWYHKFYEENGRHPTNEEYAVNRREYIQSNSYKKLDYSAYNIIAEYDEHLDEIFVTIRNPDNKPETGSFVLAGKTVIARAGEIVDYSYTNETFEKMRIKGEYDLTQIRDTVKIEVLFTSGYTKTVYLQIGHDADGVLTMRASEIV